MAHAHAHAHSEGGGDVHEHVHRGEEHAESGVAAKTGFTPHEAKQAGRLGLVVALVAGFFVLELVGALAAESVVLQADALHLLMDVFALGVSLVAMRLAVRRPTPRFTFGLRRAEPVAAIFSAFLVLGTTVGIVFEGARALEEHTPPKAGLMLLVAVAALVVNGVSAWLLHDALGHAHGAHAHASDTDNPDDPGDAEHDHPHGHSLNLRGAWLHLLGDTLGAVAALGAALAIRFGGPAVAWADPVASFAVAAILVFGAVRLLRDATLVLLEAAPPHLSVAAIRAVIRAFPGVEGVHDLHVWSLGAGHDAVTAHVVTSSADAAFAARLSARLRQVLHVEYVTVQAEPAGPGDEPSVTGGRGYA